MFATVRKSDNGKVIIVSRPSGYAVSTLNPHWNQTSKNLGVETLEWDLVQKNLTLDAANDIFAELVA